MPYAEMYQASRKEASRKKPVFFTHKYFARRITANFRMALLGFFSERDVNIYEKFYCKSDQQENITILDPFMGGGTTIFESLRFGCRVIGRDLQPLSVLVTKALVQPVDDEKVQEAVKQLDKSVGTKIRGYYHTTCPICQKQADTMYAFHVKKVKTRSSCKTHKMFSSFVLAYKKNEFTIVCPQCGKVEKTKFEDGHYVCACGWELMSPKDSYIHNGKFVCPDCNESFVLSDLEETTGYPFDTDIVAIEYYCPHCGAHDYKAPEKIDFDNYNRASSDLKMFEDKLPIPQQEIPIGYNTNQILNHNYRKFKDLFNSRQLLCLGLLLDEINHMEDKETQFWLQLAFSGMLEMNNMFCRYQQNAYKICNIFFNHAYVPISMPVENCVWGTKLGTGTFIKTVSKILRGKKFNKNIYDLSVKKGTNGRFDSVQIKSEDVVCANCVDTFSELDSKHVMLSCGDSRDLSNIPDESVDMVLTDPPYGANVMYSELIDFFHVWNYHSTLASQLGFLTPLSPKTDEIVVNSIAGKDFSYYQNGIEAVFRQCYSKIKKNGYLVFSFHDKSIDSWLAILESIASSGFRLTTCYPVQAETRTGAHTSNKNSIGIDIMLVSRKVDSYETQLTMVTDTKIQEAISLTRDEVINILEKLQNVEAEITVPDIQNMAIGKFFTCFPEYFGYDLCSKNLILASLNSLVENIESVAEGFEITKKRNGWWSELYKSKWDI